MEQESPLHAANSTFIDVFEFVRKRRSFLTHPSWPKDSACHCFWFILKCFIAGYGVANILKRNLTYALMICYWLGSSICDWNLSSFWYHSSILLINAVAQYFYRSVLTNAAVWAFTSCDTSFQFFLDEYVMVTLLTCFFRAYEREYDTACTILVYMYAMSWICDQFTEPSGLLHSVASLYFPATFSSMLLPVHRRRGYALVYSLGYMLYRLFAADTVWRQYIPQREYNDF